MYLSTSRPSCKDCWAKYFIHRIGPNFNSASKNSKEKTNVTMYCMILFQTDADRNIMTVSHSEYTGINYTV